MDPAHRLDLLGNVGVQLLPSFDELTVVVIVLFVFFLLLLIVIFAVVVKIFEAGGDVLCLLAQCLGLTSFLSRLLLLPQLYLGVQRGQPRVLLFLLVVVFVLHVFLFLMLLLGGHALHHLELTIVLLPVAIVFHAAFARQLLLHATVRALRVLPG